MSAQRYRAYDRSFTFADMRDEWQHIPVEELGYPSSEALLHKSDAELVALAATAAAARYDEQRNHDGVWRQQFHAMSGKHVLDFGCGFGLESLELAKRGNTITLCDLHPSNVLLASRLLAVHGLAGQLRATTLSHDEAPYFESPDGPVDVFYCNGVLHHIPYPRAILVRAAELLAERGEMRLMLYTNLAWEQATGHKAPPVDDDTACNPLAPLFRKSLDCVGLWADWYNAERIVHRFGDFLDLVSYTLLNRNGCYAAAVLRPKR